MPQSNVIFAFLFIGFLVWITVRGELGAYAGFLLGTATPAGGSNVASSGNNTNTTATSSNNTAAYAQAAAQTAIALMG